MLKLERTRKGWRSSVVKMLRIMNKSSFGRADAVDLVNLLLVRFPLLNKALVLFDGMLGTMIGAQARAALISCVRLRAVLDFIKWKMFYPEFYSAFGLSRALQIGKYWLLFLIEDSRMWVNNYVHSDLTGHLEDIQALLPTDDAFPEDDVTRIAARIGQFWARALDAPTSETAEGGWLRRYLVFEVGRAYRAYSPADLLFAVYKLFDLPDLEYGREAELYRLLLRRAGCRHLGGGADDGYGWLRELAEMRAANDDVLPCVLPPAWNARARPLAVSPANFGLFCLDAHAGPPAGPAGELPLHAIVDLGQAGVFTAVLGFRLDPAAQLAARRLRVGRDGGPAPAPGGPAARCFARVDKAQGTEIDQHLTLRGRRALAMLEDRLHVFLREALAAPWAGPCGLFVAGSFNAQSSLVRCLVVRASLGEEGRGAAGGRWTIECLAAFESEKQKGGSWGLCRVLENLRGDMAGLPGGGCEFASRRLGDDPPDFGEWPFLAPPPAAGAPEWFSYPVALAAGPPPECVTVEPEEAEEGDGSDGYFDDSD